MYFRKSILRIGSYIFLIFGLFALDQLTKDWAKSFLIAKKVKVFSITFFCNIIDIWNDGIGFGLFSGLSYTNSILIVLGSITVVGIFVLIFAKAKSRGSILLSFVIAGAIGNLVDRIRYGAVYDFIDLYIEQFHLPAFNLADVWIFIGVMLLMWDGLR